jgi:hypothetical protein
MSITRRQFLLSTAGASVGAIIPDFYFRALQFFEQFGEPLLEPPKNPTGELYTFNHCEAPELCLGDPWEGPPKLTFREFFVRYEPEGLETFEEMWGRGPDALDDPMDDEEYLWDCWSRHDCPTARAYHYLQTLDLGPELAGPNAVGGLDFSENFNMAHSWLAVNYEDDVTLSLLQKRLNDLGTGIRLVNA